MSMSASANSKQEGSQLERSGPYQFIHDNESAAEVGS